MELKKLKKWTYPDNYSGESFFEYYRTGIGRSRDSEILEESNFHSMLEALGGESETVIVERAGHWACGWVEGILIHESDEKSLKIADDIMVDFESYPVIDEMDWSEREQEYYSEYADQSKGDLAQVLVNLFGLPEEMAENKDLLQVCYAMQVSHQQDNGEQSSLWTNQYTPSDQIPERDIERIERALREVSFYESENPAHQLLTALFNQNKGA